MLSANSLKEEGNRLASQNPRAALQKYEEAINANPNFHQAWFNKGLMHKKLEEYDQAIGAFKKAFELDSKYEKAKVNHAQTLFLQKKYKEAWDLFVTLSTSMDGNIGQFLCEQHIAARVIFANVDLKLTKDNQVKILEFGPGVQSGFEGLRLATGQAITQLLDKEFKRLSLIPIINSVPGQQVSDHAPLRKALCSLPKPQGEFRVESIKGYRAVYGGYELKSISRDERILLMDDNIVNFIFGNKMLTHEAFIETHLEEARPHTLIFKRQYEDKLAQEIRSRLKGVKQFILKVPDEEEGKGVMVVDDADLDLMLTVLLAPHDEKEARHLGAKFAAKLSDIEKLQLPRKMQKLGAEENRIGTWKNSQSYYFMVEEYVQGKAITYQNNHYDATMRVAFFIIRDNGEMRCEPFACYWKLPPKSMGDSSELRERTVSSFSSTRRDAVAVSDEDRAVVYSRLKNILPNIVQNMMIRNIPDDIKECAQETKDEKIYKAYLWMRFANVLAYQGQYRLAEYYLNNATSLVPDYYQVYHQKGVTHHLQGQYQQAIDSYSEALKKDQRQSAPYYRRGMTWLAMGEQAKADKDFDEAIKMYPPCKREISELQHRRQEIDNLIKKYKLKNSSQLELEKGLRRAASQKNKEDVEIFISYVENIDAQGAESGKTALHQASEASSLECVRILLGYGAHANVKDTDRKIPSEYTNVTKIKEILNCSSSLDEKKELRNSLR